MKKFESQLLDVGEILLATNGEIVAGYKDSSISHVAIDSREVLLGSLFVALLGQSLDGHNFIEDALKKGAGVVLVDAEHASKNEAQYCDFSKKYKQATFVRVDDTLKALQKLAAYYLYKVSIRVHIGVTGSSGKTTVKEMIATIFEVAGYRTFKTKGNLNSCTGVPLSIFDIRGRGYDVAVFEVGMNRRGEIREITEVITPHIALVTNIGTAHIGMLGSRDAIATEKGEIFSQFTEQCLGVIPDCEFTQQLMNGKKGEFVIIDSDYLKRFEGSKAMGLEGCLLNYEGTEIHLHLLGAHNIYNAILAIAVAEKYSLIAKSHITKSHIKEALEKMRAVSGRAELKKGFATCIFDCYNANPASMQMALDLYEAMEWKGRKIAILGSMLELGDESLAEHEKVCAKVSKSKSDAVFLMGEEMLQGFVSFANKCCVQKHRTSGGGDGLGQRFLEFPNSHFEVEGTEYFCYRDDEMVRLKEDVRQKVRRGDFVLLKASHGLHFERLEEVLIGATVVSDDTALGLDG